MNVVAFAPCPLRGPASVAALSMKLCGVLLILELLCVERSDAHGASHGTALGHLSPEESLSGLAGLTSDLDHSASSASAGIGLLSPESLVELTNAQGSSPRHEEVWIEVRASSADAPTPANPQAFNELTVAVRAKAPIRTISLRLPERQYCPFSPGVCFGYEFSEAKDFFQQCDIVPWPYTRLDLPKSGLGVVDVYKKGLIEGCTVNNTSGDNGPSDKRRSHMMMTLRQDVPAAELTDTWLVFKIKVKNAQETPITMPDAKYTANTWQVVVRSMRELLGRRFLAAPKIVPLWMCSYTDWIWTAPCTARCGGGVRYSVRRLLHPPPESYPRELLVDCNKPLSQTHECNEEPCSVDCQLGDWTPFSDGPCSVTCGKGFQIQRRRVVEGPIGKGQLCPAHNDVDVRVRYRECEAKEPCAPRCDLAGQGDDAALYGTCSDVCLRGAGKKDVVPVITRKEPLANSKSCNAEIKQMPCGVHCSSINFLPSAPGRLPRIGKWIEVVLVFFINNIVEGMTLVAPQGFEIGMQNGRCLIKDHNLPRLKRCRVSEKKGRALAIFDLYNALEPKFPTQSGGTRQPQYEVRFYVKSPATCEGGFNRHTGACKVSAGEWDWTLHTWSDEGDGFNQERERVAFNVYNDQAKDWHPFELASLTEEAEKEFLLGTKDIDEVIGDWEDGVDEDQPVD